MSEIKNGGLDQYGARPFEQQQFGTAGVERVKDTAKRRRLCAKSCLIHASFGTHSVISTECGCENVPTLIVSRSCTAQIGCNLLKLRVHSLQLHGSQKTLSFSAGLYAFPVNWQLGKASLCCRKLVSRIAILPRRTSLERFPESTPQRVQ